MCGIVGEFGRAGAPSVRKRMLERLEHRGPDDHGSVTLPVSWLGHRRLSIVDVDGGTQPISNEAGDTWLVGNGEVYNHGRVRRSLDGRSYATRSDNEVALHLLEERGPGALGELSGMFAFILAGEDGRFVAARDPVGIKPLYWARRDGITRFASEMRSFDFDWLPLVEYFPPGCFWTPERGLERFEDPVPEGARAPMPGPERAGAAIPDDVLAETREVLVRSVEGQMMGDVDVGVFLSGGLDSSLVAAIAQRHLERSGERLKTFAVGTPGSPDLAAARTVAQHLGTDHRETVYTPEEALATLPEVVRVIESFDPSLVRSAVPNYMLARFTARHVKVVLTGEGADELFSGYEYLRSFEDGQSLHAELVRIVRSLHNLNLQRCDRVTMAHGLEARVPFLDRDVIALGLRLPAGWKLAAPGQPEKRLLRLAFDGWLPDELLWREKAEFGDGSGAADAISGAIAATVSDAELERERGQLDPPLRSKEEAAYHRVFREHLGGVRTEGIGRFATA
jgi:asparagine synthase (glutamine-hydrolysing)